jgi:diguanylate cyclase (GGDEF)-like protein/PAS domain S-box-containing protein
MKPATANLLHDAGKITLFAGSLLPALVYLYVDYSLAQQGAGKRLLHDSAQSTGLLDLDRITNGLLLAASGLLFGWLLLTMLRHHLIEPLASAQYEQKESQTRLYDLLELSADWFWETDAALRFTMTTPGRSFAGLNPELLIGKHYAEINCGWSHSPEQWAAHEALLLQHQPFDTSYSASVDGVLTWFNIQGKARYDADGKFCGYRGTVRDISERITNREELRVAATAFEMQECIMVINGEGCLLRVNEAFQVVTGYNADEVVGQSITILKSDRQEDAFYERILETLAQAQEKFWHGEFWSRHRNGDYYLCEMTIKGVKGSFGSTPVNGILLPDVKTDYYVGSFHDITKRREAENNIHQLAFYDPLTHLPNRRLLFDRITKAQATSKRNGHHGALMFIDLDNFKKLNDTRGHDVGDMLLCEVAQRLQSIVRAEDSVVRLGGDEFVVMLENLDSEAAIAAAEADEIGHKLLTCLNEPFNLKGQEVHSTPSVGIVLFCGETQSIEQILKHADAAMYQSKAAGRNTLHFFDPDMQSALEARATMEVDLRAAIRAGQFRLYYQAQVDNTGHIIGAEALIRWIHPLRGMISPADFIPLAEDSGLILPMGQWVLEAACTQLKIWSSSTLTRHLTLAVNVSARQYHQKDFVEQVLTVLDQSGADPRKLKLELTESLLVKDIEDVITKMTALKARGVCFSLDDFGTGYSSLSYLKRLPLDQLKIDQSFVRDLERDDNDATICAATIGLAHNLGLAVVAEGVESEAQRYFLGTVHRCNFMQGYLFAKPLPQHEFASLMATSLQTERVAA